MKIVLFNRFFYPDTSATSQLLSDLAFYLATKGHEIHVVASSGSEVIKDSRIVRGVTVHRVSGPTRREGGVIQKGLGYLAYLLGARRKALELLDRTAVCVVKTDPPMLASAIGGIATRAHAPMIVWLQDVFPEVAQRFGIPGMSGLAARTFIRLRNTSLRNASQIVVIGESMRSIISQSVGREANSINVIHNWADGEAIVPIAHETNRLRAAWAEAGAFVVGYSGNLGRVHEFDTLLGAAQCLSPDTSVRFVIVGTGPRLQEVRLKVTQLGLKNISFHPLQPREELSLSLGVPDVHIAVLRPEFEGLVHPSKIYGIMAAGRPIIFVGDYRGEASKMIQAHDFGYAVECGNAAGLARAIQALKEAPDERRRMGLNARMSFEAHYDMPIALAQWEMLLQRTWDTR